MNRANLIVAGFIAIALSLAYVVFGPPGMLGEYGMPITTAVLLTAPTSVTGGAEPSMTAQVRLRNGTSVEASVPANCNVGIGQTVRLLVVPPEGVQSQPQYQVMGLAGGGV